MKLLLQIGTLSSLNIGLSFLFQWYVLTQLGPGIESDSLFAGMTIPQLVLAVISGSLMHVLVPILAGENEERLRHDAWGLLVIVGGLFGLLAVFCYVTAPWWVPLTVPGFDEESKSLTIELTRIQIIGMLFAAVNGVQLATYHARRQFAWAEFTQVLASTFALLLLVWALPLYGVIAAAWISTLRMATQTWLLGYGMGKPIRPDLHSKNIRQAWKRIKPLLLGSTYYQTDPLVDRFLLSTASSGSLSLYYLAQQLYGAVSQVINKAIAAPMVPLLSKLHKSGDIVGFRNIYLKKISQVSAITIVGMLILTLFGQSILALLIGYGNVSSSNVDNLWWIMLWLGGVFLGSATGQIASSSFYACGDTITPTRISIITYTLYIPSKVIAFNHFGVMGLALTTSLYYIINFSLQIYLLERNWKV